MLGPLLTPGSGQDTIPAMRRCVLILLVAAFLSAQGAQELEITAEPHHQLVLANDHVRVFDVDIAPHSESLTHWHRHDYFYVVLGAAEIVNAVKGKDPVTLTLSDGEVRFVSASFAHTFRNLSGQRFRNRPLTGTPLIRRKTAASTSSTGEPGKLCL